MTAASRCLFSFLISLYRSLLGNVFWLLVFDFSNTCRVIVKICVQSLFQLPVIVWKRISALQGMPAPPFVAIKGIEHRGSIFLVYGLNTHDEDVPASYGKRGIKSKITPAFRSAFQHNLTRAFVFRMLHCVNIWTPSLLSSSVCFVFRFLVIRFWST